MLTNRLDGAPIGKEVQGNWTRRRMRSVDQMVERIQNDDSERAGEVGIARQAEGNE